METSAPQIVLIARDPELDSLIQGLQADGIQCVTAQSVQEAEAAVERTEGRCIAVVDGALPSEEAFQVYRLLHGVQPVPTLMLVRPGNYQQFALDPHRYALDEFVPKPVQNDELALRVKAMMFRAGMEMPARPVAAFTSAGVHDLGAAHEGEERDGMLVVVFAAKGGVGKSMVATNLAIGLQQFYEKKTLLVDGDLWFGDVGVLMNVRSTRTLFDITSGHEPDFATVQQVVVEHPSGVWILLRPSDPAMVDRIDPTAVTRAAALYRQLYDYVIVDTHPAFDEMNLQLLDAADRILVVTTPELSATANTSSFLQIADSLGYKGKVTLVLNRANSGIRLDALEETLGMPVTSTIVSAGRFVVESANEGASLFARDPTMKEKVTRDMMQLLEHFAGEPRPARKVDKAKSDAGRLFAGFRRRSS